MGKYLVMIYDYEAKYPADDGTEMEQNHKNHEAFPEAKILVTGVEDPATQAHSINESLHLGVLERAATAEALLLQNLGSNGQVTP